MFGISSIPRKFIYIFFEIVVVFIHHFFSVEPNNDMFYVEWDPKNYTFFALLS